MAFWKRGVGILELYAEVNQPPLGKMGQENLFCGSDGLIDEAELCSTGYRAWGLTPSKQCFSPFGVKEALGPAHSCSNSACRRRGTPQDPGSIHWPTMPTWVRRKSRMPAKKRRLPGLCSQLMLSIARPPSCTNVVRRKPFVSKSFARMPVRGSTGGSGGSGSALPRLDRKSVV